MFRFVIISVIVLLITSCQEEGATPPAPPVSGVLEIKNESLSFKVDPATGGRIASLQYLGVEMLSTKRDTNNWCWGSTIWPAPQSDWNWPPPAAMDQGPYRVKEATPGKIALESLPNAYKTLRLEKTFSLVGEQSVGITYQMTNTGDSTLAVGIWENTRINYRGRARWKTGVPLPDTIVGLSRDSMYSSFEFAGHDEPAKLFVDTDAGWVSYLVDGIQFTKSFPGQSIEQVAPDQAQIEIYYDPIKGFAEIEEHGPYEQLAPGEQTQWIVLWHLAKEDK